MPGISGIDLLKTIKRKQKKYATPPPKPMVIVEHNFIAKADKVIEDNLQNPQFEIEDLLQKLKVSKTTLGRKLKAETQLNTSAFVRDVRLRNAIKLICNKQFSTQEIAAYVGYNSTSYFIRTFKTKYGVTPKEYQEQAKENNDKD